MHMYSLATPPINRDAVAQQLINRRGRVVDTYDEDAMVGLVVWLSCDESRDYSHVCYHSTMMQLKVTFINLSNLFQFFRRRFFVLSDTCCRTHKYLIGLALGVPCVCYGWIKDCIEKVNIVCVCVWRA